MNTQLDPVSAEDLDRLQQLEVARRGIADRLLELEESKIALLGAAKRVSNEWATLFRRVAEERGIPEGTPYDIDPRTGAIIFESASPGAAEEPAAEETAED